MNNTTKRSRQKTQNEMAVSNYTISKIVDGDYTNIAKLRLELAVQARLDMLNKARQDQERLDHGRLDHGRLGQAAAAAIVAVQLVARNGG